MPHALHRRVSALLAACFLAVALPAAPPSFSAGKRPLQQKDFAAWRSLTTPTLARDGRILAYAFMPQEGDGDLVIRDLRSGRESRHGAGALPPPPVQLPEEVNPEAPPPQPGLRIAVTSDGRFVVSTTYPPKADTDAARKARKKPEEMPKGGLLLVDTASRAEQRLERVKSVQVPAKGGAWIAYLREPKPEPRKEGAREPKPEAAPATRAAEKKEFGSDLVLRDLASGREQTFPDVLEYSFARDGRTLLFAVAGRNEARNGVYAATPGTDGEPVALSGGKGRYLKLAWDREQRQVAWISSRDNAESATPRFRVYRWVRGEAAAAAVVGADTPGFPAGLVVADKGTLGFSRDGARLYVPAAVPGPASSEAKEAAEEGGEDKVLADLWHWQDDFVQPMQKVRANQDRARSYRGVYHIAERRYVQVADPTLPTAAFSDDGTRALGFDDRPYRRRVDFDGTYSDVWLVDTRSGARSLVAKGFRGGFGGRGGAPFLWSPDGRHAAFFADRHWHLLEAATGVRRNLTEALGVAFHREDHDTPDAPGSYGQAGWTKDSRSFLAYDRFDLWALPTEGGVARNLSAGEGRASRTELRVVRIDPLEEDDEDRGLDPAKPLVLRGESIATRATGFYRQAFDGGRPARLIWGDRSYRFVARAKDADTLLLSASRFDSFPDLLATDPSFRSPVPVTAGGAQLAPFQWGSAELVPFRSAGGADLQAALYKPEGFDPRRKYPMLVYIYERLSQDLHTFRHPAPGHNPNPSFYVSNGYLVLMPDIVYTTGNPGQSALDCVLPAVQAVVDRGGVDERAIGIAGHSWGGYQIAYMVTRTDRFRAAEAGAPVGNMTSAYSGIRWGSGQPRQFQYERTQSRIGPSLAEAPLKYLENSPVFLADRVRTPLLILHDDLDDAVPWTQGIELFLALRRHGKEAYLFNYNGEFHGLRRRHNQKDYALRMQQYFDHFLKGAAKPAWMERGIPFLEREEEKPRFAREATR